MTNDEKRRAKMFTIMAALALVGLASAAHALATGQGSWPVYVSGTFLSVCLVASVFEVARLKGWLR